MSLAREVFTINGMATEKPAHEPCVKVPPGGPRAPRVLMCRFYVENLMLLQQVLADLHLVHRVAPKKLPPELT